jgi:four helix bundle protein
MNYELFIKKLRMKEHVIREKYYAFALEIISLYKYLMGEKKKFVLSKQISRSDTSNGANVEEALAASSKAYFIYKLYVAAKENRETSYWLRLLKDSGFIAEKSFSFLHQECLEMQKIFSNILITSKTNS